MKLLALSDSEKEYQDSDLENSIIKILSDNNSSFFNLAALFEAEGGREEEVINIEIINKIANTLGLLFINPKEREGKVCFANSQDLRPDFKQSFVLLDLLNFSSAVLHSRIYRQGKQDFLEIPIPSDSCIFWQLVQIGSNLRNK
ncbi:hypothetical protein ASC72_02840 [Flavobacterium sp. Root420]|nr:hypothetical protein ASC72_02840 [Flavobacterium sp. Root420]